MDRLAYASKEQAEKITGDIGCEGIHEHEFENQTWYMPCKQHSLEEEFEKLNIHQDIKDYVT